RSVFEVLENGIHELFSLRRKAFIRRGFFLVQSEFSPPPEIQVFRPKGRPQNRAFRPDDTLSELKFLVFLCFSCSPPDFIFTNYSDILSQITPTKYRKLPQQNSANYSNLLYFFRILRYNSRKRGKTYGI